jgi:hypothetical protein
MLALMESKGCEAGYFHVEFLNAQSQLQMAIEVQLNNGARLGYAIDITV